MESRFFENCRDLNFGRIKVQLKDGNQMPAVGLGTYRVLEPNVINMTVDHALESGYRLFDTAAVYGNEYFLGKALRASLEKHKLKREDIYVITKLDPNDYGYHKVPVAFQNSLDNLDLGYIDMYLIHFPGTAKVQASNPLNRQIRHETWSALVKLQEQGLVRSIGVSNFTVDHLKRLRDYSPIKPAVNQVEWHPYYYQPELLQYCRQNSIELQAYCPFGGASKGRLELLKESVVKDLAEKHDINEGQVLLLWSLQQGVSVVPKSVTPYNISNNIHLEARLTVEDMQALNDLHKNLKYAWDPTTVLY